MRNRLRTNSEYQQISKEIINKFNTKFNFREGQLFMWSPAENTIYFKKTELTNIKGIWSLLHELGHALENHIDFRLDVDLIRLELEAWEKAKEVAGEFKLQIDQDHIEDSLDTYRDWIKRRSTCPDCLNTNMQTEALVYKCFNCGCRWQVSKSQIHRIVRRKL